MRRKIALERTSDLNSAYYSYGKHFFLYRAWPVFVNTILVARGFHVTGDIGAVSTGVVTLPHVKLLSKVYQYDSRD